MAYKRKTEDVWVIEANPWSLGWGAFGTNPIYGIDELALAQMDMTKLEREYPTVPFRIEVRRIPKKTEGK